MGLILLFQNSMILHKPRYIPSLMLNKHRWPYSESILRTRRAFPEIDSAISTGTEALNIYQRWTPSECGSSYRTKSYSESKAWDDNT